MEIIAEEGRGVIVLIRSASVTDLSDYVRKQGGGSMAPNQLMNEPSILFKDYGVGAQILRDLGVQEMVLLSNTKRSIVGLEGHNLRIIEQRAIKFSEGHRLPVGPKFYD